LELCRPHPHRTYTVTAPVASPGRAPPAPRCHRRTGADSGRAPPAAVAASARRAALALSPQPPTPRAAPAPAP